MMAVLGTVEMAMRDAGMKVKPGSGVAAAGEYYRKNAKKIKKFGATQAPREARVATKKKTKRKSK